MPARHRRQLLRGIVVELGTEVLAQRLHAHPRSGAAFANLGSRGHRRVEPVRMRRDVDVERQPPHHQPGDVEEPPQVGKLVMVGQDHRVEPVDQPLPEAPGARAVADQADVEVARPGRVEDFHQSRIDRGFAAGELDPHPPALRGDIMGVQPVVETDHRRRLLPARRAVMRRGRAIAAGIVAGVAQHPVDQNDRGMARIGMAYLGWQPVWQASGLRGTAGL